MSEDLHLRVEIDGRESATKSIAAVENAIKSLVATTAKASSELRKTINGDVLRSMAKLRTESRGFGDDMIESTRRAMDGLRKEISEVNELRDAIKGAVAAQAGLAKGMGGTRSATASAGAADARAVQKGAEARLRAIRDTGRAERNESDRRVRESARRWRIREASEKAERAEIAKTEKARKKAYEAEFVATKKLKKERNALWRGAWRSGRHAFGHAEHAVRRISSPFHDSPALAAEMGAAFGIEAGRKIVESTLDIDTAAARFRMLAVPDGADAAGETAKARHQALLDSIDLGTSAATILDMVTKSVRDGVPGVIASTLPKSIAAASQVMGGDPERLTDSLAEGLQEAFAMKWIKSPQDARKFLNIEAGLSNYAGNSAEKTEQFIAAGGLGHGKEMGLDLEKTMAFGSMLNASGARTGQASARFMGQLSQNIPKMFDKWRSATESRRPSEENRAVRSAPMKLGYGSIREMQAKIMAGPENLIDFATRLETLDDKARKLVLQGYGFSEQGGAMLAELGAGGGTKAKAILARAHELASQKEATDYLSSKFAEWQTSLAFMLRQIEAGWRAIESEIGDVLKLDVLAPLRDWWALVSAEIVNSGIKSEVHSAIVGFVNGLGFNDVRAMLESMTADVHGFDVAGFAKGLGEGIRAVVDDLKALMAPFASMSGDGSAEAIGKLAAELFGFSIAAHAVGPVISIIASMASVFLALKAAVELGGWVAELTGVSGALKGLAALPYAEAVAGLATLTGSIAALIGLAGLAAQKGILDPPKSLDGKGILGFLDPNLPGLWDKLLGGVPKAPKDLAPSQSDQAMAGLLQLQSWQGGDGREWDNLRQGISYRPSDSADMVLDSITGTERGVYEVKDAVDRLGDRMRAIGGLGASGGGTGGGGAVGAALPNMRYGHGSDGSYRVTPGGKAWTNGPAGSFSAGPGTDAGTRYTSKGGKGMTAAGKARVASWMDFFMRSDKDGGMGLPRDKAAAMVGMMQGESGQNLDPTIDHYDVNGPSIGTAQWHDVDGKGGRASALKAFAARLGKDWRDVGVQQQFWKHEAQTSHRAAWNAVVNAPDGPSALREGVRRFEVPRDAEGEVRKRMPNYSRIMQGGFDKDPAVAGDKPLGSPGNPATVKVDPKSIPSGREDAGSIAGKVLNRTRPGSDDTSAAGRMVTADAAVTNHNTFHVHGAGDPHRVAQTVVAHLDLARSKTIDWAA